MKKKKYIQSNKSKAKVVRFPTDYNPKTVSEDYVYDYNYNYIEDYDDNYIDDFEDWEPLVELRDNEDYPGLVKYCEKKAERHPDDPYAQYYLGEAYVLNVEYEKAIQFLSEHHKKIPYSTDYQYVILDALFALGKNEDDFEWIEKPIVLRMSKKILDTCYEFLKPKKKPRTVADLYMEFITKGYLYFKEEDLYKALVEDSRFSLSSIYIKVLIWVQDNSLRSVENIVSYGKVSAMWRQCRSCFSLQPEPNPAVSFTDRSAMICFPYPARSLWSTLSRIRTPICK